MKINLGVEERPMGFSIFQSAAHLRNYAAVEKAFIKVSAGWFLGASAYENKYQLGYHLYDSSEHVSWLRNRMVEMRAGRPDASIRPDLRNFLEEMVHAPDEDSFWCGVYGVLKPALLSAIEHDLTTLDASGNANECRLLKRIAANLQAQLEWFQELKFSRQSNAWAAYLDSYLEAIGGWHGEEKTSSCPEWPVQSVYRRPKTILFDERIKIDPLMEYQERLKLDSHGAAIEQFKVFFNELYAAALLASILFDAIDDEYPWEFFADLSRHFWDEVRHSEFGAIRLKELGVEPSVCNPILFEHSEGLPVLHRVVYLTRGLEAYFMPRKPQRMKEYEESGDRRSQLFADQDWSDEINHVQYGTKWSGYLLEHDSRDVHDVIEEVKEHLSKMTGDKVTTISAPF